MWHSPMPFMSIYLLAKCLTERKHRHIMEVGLSLLAQSHLPTKFWVDAFMTAIYLINRTPTPVLDNISPYSKLFAQTPDYSFLRMFGCACYPLLRPYTPHKLTFCRKQCVFIGYSSHHHGYHCLDTVAHKIYISCSVAFDEHTFPAKGWPSSSLPATLGISRPGMSFDLTPFYSQLPSESSNTSRLVSQSVSPESNSPSISDAIQSSPPLTDLSPLHETNSSPSTTTSLASPAVSNLP